MSFIAIDRARVAAKFRRNVLDKNLLLSAAAIALIASPSAYANPAGGAVTTGSASISTSSNKTNVNQKSEDVVIDWSSFNIGNGQTTQFVQPNAQAIAVNRIGGASASQILGTLDANGRIVLINGNGMLFGKNSQVNVGSLIATSTDGSDGDLLAGKFTQAGKQNARVVNQGQIVVGTNGVVALVAPSVTNAGTVNAKLGTVALGAANKFTVDFSGDGLVSFAAQGDVNARASAINTGLLSGANVSMTAHAANGIATGVVNMSGVITAQGVQNVGGMIYLNAGNGVLTSTGTLNAAGATGGGHIETSGETANVTGKITAGKGGKWLVDPNDLDITASDAATIDGALNGGSSVELLTTSSICGGYGTCVPGGVGDINIQSPMSWNSSASLTIDAYHSINVLAPITVQGGGGLTLLYNTEGTNGTLSFGLGQSGFAGNIAFTDVISGATQGNFSINGNSFALANSVSQLASDISSNAGGSYALANSYNASGDGTYSQSPITTTFAGTFEGLGNTISNLTIDDESTGHNVGLFSETGGAGVIRDIGLLTVNVTAGDDARIGGLVGYNQGSMEQDYVTGSTSGSTGASVGGFTGLNNGTISLSHSSTNTVGYNDDVGGFTGENGPAGVIEQSYAEGSVSSSVAFTDLGGLAGVNTGEIEQSFATASVIDTDSSAYSTAGGLVGINTGTGAISESYASGLVRAYYAGGLVGVNQNTIAQSFAFGIVDGLDLVRTGGLVGWDQATSGDITNSYWDLGTTGITGSSRGAGNTSNDSGITGEATSTLQGALPSGFSNTVWGTGAGLYPYFLWQYPSGTPQAVSGIAYSNGGGTVLQGGTVSALLDGNALGTVSTGANGYYYLLVAPGTISDSNQALLAYSSADGARLDTAADTIDANNNVSGFDVWGDTLIAPTSDTTYSTASATSLQTQDSTLIAQAIGTNANATTGLTNYGYIATGSGFAIDQLLTLSNGLYVKTTSGNIGVNDVLTLPGSEGLTLDSHGSLTIDAPVNVTGGGGVILDAGYDTTTVPGTPLLELSFGLGSGGFAGDMNYAKGSGEGISGQSLTINGTSFTLLYSMTDVQNIYTPSNVGNPSGNYALADSLDASGFDFFPIGNAFGTRFSGWFEGLGHTISNLSVASLNPPGGSGLFSGSSGTIRDMGMVGGSMCCGANDGFLVGVDSGVIENTFETGTVQSNSFNDPSAFAGGLVGQATSSAVIANSYATGQITRAVSGTGGLVGDLQGTLVNDYATISVVGFEGGSSIFGGLVGEADSGSRIENSYATGSVTASSSREIGGLVGYLDGGSISGSFATGAVSGTSDVGGLVGESEEGAISNSYAMGAVSGSNQVGGLVGALFDPSSSVTNSFSIGRVTGSSSVGGLVGLESDSGGVTDSYWDTQTSGQPSDGAGATPLTTTQMQGTFANMTGFAGPTWATGTGLFPYLSWQFANTPQVVSGFTAASNGTTGVPGLDVALLVNGASVTPAIATSSGANGYYYLLLAPGTISNSGSPLFAYLTNGTPGNSYVGNALGGDGNLEIEEGQLRVRSGASSVTGLFRALNTAVGSNTGADFLYTSSGGLTPNINLFLDDSAANFNINSGLDVGSLWLYDPKGAISESGGGTITAGLLRGTTKNGVTLNGANEIAALGAFTNTGSGGFALTDGETLAVHGALNAGTGTLSLTTTNGGSINLFNSLTTGGMVTLTSAGAIWQDTASSVITAATLTGSANGATRLQGANLITDLGAFTNTGGNFYLTDAQTLTATGTVNAGTYDMFLETTSGDLVVSGALDANVVSLTSSLGEVNGAGTITADVLDASADTGIDLTGSNDITHLGQVHTNSGTIFINR